MENNVMVLDINLQSILLPRTTSKVRRSYDVQLRVVKGRQRLCPYTYGTRSSHNYFA